MICKDQCYKLAVSVLLLQPIACAEGGTNVFARPMAEGGVFENLSDVWRREWRKWRYDVTKQVACVHILDSHLNEVNRFLSTQRLSEIS